MAYSVSRILKGLEPWDPAPRTCGPLGINDAADPFSPIWGDTPGSLGLNDWAVPEASPVVAAQNVTGEQLSRMVPSLGAAANEVAPNLSAALREAQVDTEVGKAMFVAQVAVESANFTKLEEGGGKTVYNSETGERSSYKEYLKTKEEDRDPDDKVYDYFFFMYDKDSPSENRKKVAAKLGNTKAGDGARYRGRGYIQLTGRSNYREAGAALKLPLEDQPDLASEPANAARIAGWYWRKRNLNRYTRFDTNANFRAVTKGINGAEDAPETHLAKRQEIYSAAKTVLGLNTTAAKTGSIIP